MAIVAQANVAQLRSAETKRRPVKRSFHDIRVPPPGAVIQFREALIDHRRLRGYDDAQIHLRLHEVWGHYCLLCWLLRVEDPQLPPRFAELPDDHQMHCPTALEVKTAEIEAVLWRLHFEQRLRWEVQYRQSPGFARALAIAKRIPITLFGGPIEQGTDDALVAGACEYAGMLAAVRWCGNRDRSWGQPGIMEIDESAFLAEVTEPPGP